MLKIQTSPKYASNYFSSLHDLTFMYGRDQTIFAGGPNNLFAINVLGIVVVDGALTNIVTYVFWDSL